MGIAFGSDNVDTEYEIKLKELLNITQQQDRMNLSISAINESAALIRSMIDFANAIILECATWGGDFRPPIAHGYLREKVESLIYAYNGMVHDYNLIADRVEDLTPRIEHSFVEETAAPAPIEIREGYKKEFFKGFKTK